MLTTCVLPTLIGYCKSGNLLALKQILELKSRNNRRLIISKKTALGCSCLLIASKNGHMEIVSYLINACHADVEQSGCISLDKEVVEGATPLWCAATSGCLSLVQFLVGQGAKINRATLTNSTPLRAACYDGHYEVVKYLLRSGANAEIGNWFGHTCLMVACFRGHRKTVELLLSHGIRVNRQGNKGNTALHDCAETGNEQLFQLLLSQGALIRPDEYGLLPHITAANAGQVEFTLSTLDRLSPIAQIASLEVLGAHFIDREDSPDMGLTFWSQALGLQSPLSIGRRRWCIEEDPHSSLQLKRLAETVFHGLKEVASHEHLETISDQPPLIRINSLLIRLRLLGPCHPDTTFYIRRHGAQLAEAGQPEQALAVWQFLLELHRLHQEPLDALQTVATLTDTVELLHHSFLNQTTSAEMVEWLLACLQVAVDHCLRHSRGVYFYPISPEDQRRRRPWAYSQTDKRPDQLRQVLAVALYLVHTLDRELSATAVATSGGAQQRARFHRLVYRLIRLDPRCQRGLGLLHLACRRETVAGGVGGGLMLSRRLALHFPSLRVVRLLLQLGADPNMATAGGDQVRPINMVLAMRREDWYQVPGRLLKALINGGAHLDVRCLKRLRFIRAATLADPESRDCLIDSGISPLNHTSLKCLCAKVIVESRLTVHTAQLPRELRDFVAMH